MKSGVYVGWRCRLLQIASAFLLAIAYAGDATASGVPVIDTASIAQGQANQAESIAKAIEQIDQLKGQLAQMKRQYSAVTGSRALGEIANDPSFKQYLPEQWKKVYDQVANGGYKGLSGHARAIREGSSLYDACSRHREAEKALCERAAAKGAIDKAFALDAYDKAASRWDQIAALMKSINRTTDPKAIAELQARIQTEQAALQNEQTKLDLYRLVADAESKLIEQQIVERNARVWNSKGRGIQVEPMKFRRKP
ncbi:MULTISPECIES: P-type DNA transfer protein VirB5 [unclassified Pseudoxanthomonas]|uniref:P-type DNA transfer protein VirB5 n=1 Tax=unclassified Pseudoxanthomonas TaxID=2645906 RepID=UPI00307F5E5A